MFVLCLVGPLKKSHFHFVAVLSIRHSLKIDQTSSTEAGLSQARRWLKVLHSIVSPHEDIDLIKVA
jgi:hypothetical protein